MTDTGYSFGQVNQIDITNTNTYTSMVTQHITKLLILVVAVHIMTRPL